MCNILFLQAVGETRSLSVLNERYFQATDTCPRFTFATKAYEFTNCAAQIFSWYRAEAELLSVKDFPDSNVFHSLALTDKNLIVLSIQK